MTPHEIQLGTIAGCIEYLAHEPKCKIAARKLLKVLRHEQMKLQTNMGGSGQSCLIGNARVNETVAPPTHPHFHRDMKICAAAVILGWGAAALFRNKLLEWLVHVF